MALDYLQVSQQVSQLGVKALERQQELVARLSQAHELLDMQAAQLEQLRNKVLRVVHNYDRTIRCAVPVHEPLNAHFTLPAMPGQATLIAADGSQIFADRHAEVEYCLVNTGAIWMRYGSPDAPHTGIHSHLIYAEQLDGMSDDRLSLQRDLAEREMLLEQAHQAEPPVITFTDGPLELWTTTLEQGQVAGEFKRSLERYLEVLGKLQEIGASTAGYVDKPRADLVVRLLEVTHASDVDLPEIKMYRPFKGVTDRDLFRSLLLPGERSAIFGLQSRSSQAYQSELELHFFYLNVGKPAKPYLARVELPAWVVEDATRLNHLHAVLVNQCRMIGARAYPYLLHRAHETAVVTLEDKAQVTQMIVSELRKRGLEVEGESAKQFNKDISGKRTRYGS
jgi:hypothetical protein